MTKDQTDHVLSLIEQARIANERAVDLIEQVERICLDDLRAKEPTVQACRKRSQVMPDDHIIRN